MRSRAPSGLRMALISGLLLWGPATLAQADPTWVGDEVEAPNAPLRVAQAQASPASKRDRLTTNEKAALEFAFRYLDLWSAPNQVALAAASSFYGPTVRFHGRIRTLGSVLEEKRRFAERWPDRVYRHLPRTAQVTCEAGGAYCTVRSSFDFTAINPSDGRRSLGTGEHQLVVNLSGARPVIAAEDSRVVLHGRGNMSWLLEDGL